MRRFTALFALALSALVYAQDGSSSIPPKIAPEEYRERREKLMEKLNDGVVLIEADPLLAGASGIDANTPRFDYTYLTGYHRKGDVLALIPSLKKSILFSEEPEEAKRQAGMKDVMSREKLEEFLKEITPAASVFHTRLRKEAKELVEKVAEEISATVKSAGRVINREITRMRMIKSPAELALMRKASDATNKAHLAAMKACKPGMNEGELQEIIEKTFKSEGCDGLSFPSIVGSGKNGTVLHYMKNNREVPPNSLVVIDIGSSIYGYVTDITRTLPTSGKFTQEHRAAYEVVLEAQKAAEAILKPGVTFGRLERAARKVFQDRKRTDWSYAHSTAGGPRHGLGHFVGMAVHDSGEYGRPLAPGMVITIEPGYYNVRDGYGIRIEDIYVVTETGFERLSDGSPREPDEIEKMMAN